MQTSNPIKCLHVLMLFTSSSLNGKYTIRQLTNSRVLLSLSPKYQGFGSPLKVTIRTEDPNEGTHGIYFNRGVAGSTAYNQKFGDYRKWHLVSKYGRQVWRNTINPREMPNPSSQEALVSRAYLNPSSSS